MALTTLALVRMVPSMRNRIVYTDALLAALIDGSDYAIKKYTQQNLELRAWTEYYDGNEMQELVLRQRPVLSGRTTIAAGSNGVSLPTATINVASTTGFDPGGRAGNPPSLTIQTSASSWTVVTYTGKTSTTFTGCSGGTGTLSASTGLNSVGQPCVWIDPQGYGGQAPAGVPPYSSSQGPFSDACLQVQGGNYYVEVDDGGAVSYRGLLQRVGGASSYGFFGSYPNPGFGGRGKLSSRRLPCWPRGWGNIKIAYSAGYETVPPDLQMAATNMVVYMAKSQQFGGLLPGSESLGAYSYSLLQSSGAPDIGSTRQLLSRYREVAW